MLFLDPAGLAKDVEKLRTRALFEGDEGEGETLDPFAEQNFLLAIALLEAAERQFKIAALYQARALAAGRGPR